METEGLTIQNGERVPMPLLRWLLALGAPVPFILALFFFKELVVAAAVGAFMILVLSSKPRSRLVLIVALLPLAHAGLGLESFGGFGAYDIYAGLFILIFLWRSVGKGGEGSERVPILGLTGLMFIFFLPSLLSTDAMAESLKALAQFAVSALTAAAVYHYLRQDFDFGFLVRLLKVFVLVATVVSIYGVYEASVGSVFRILTGRAFFSLFEDVNYYASYLVMALAVSAGLAFVARSVKERILFSLSTVILIVTIVSTVSRSAMPVMLVLMAGYAGFMFLSQQGARRLIGFAVLIVFVGGAGVLLTTDVGSRLVDLFTLSQRVESVVGGKDASVTQRLTIVEVTQRMIEANPVIGVGIGAFEKQFGYYQGENLSAGFDRSAHNTLLRILAETGILGLVPSLLFVVVLITYMARAVLRARPGPRQILAFALLTSLASFLLMSLSLDQLFEPHFWVSCGIGLALARQIQPGVSNESIQATT